MDKPVRKLNPLLRLAVITGVESAVKLHIGRGDDLDAHDARGATPLMLAAGKQRPTIVRLLLEAGAAPALVDFKGCDALAYARRTGCPETILILTEALRLVEAERKSGKNHLVGHESEQGLSEVGASGASDSHELANDPVTPDEHEASPYQIFSEHESGASSGTRLGEGPGSDEESHDYPYKSPEPGIESTGVRENPAIGFEIILDDEPLGLDLDDWDAEDTSVAPEGDETVAHAAHAIHERIARHEAVDGDEDWGDIDLFLPERASPVTKGEGSDRIRELLLSALREGLVPEETLVGLCLDSNGSRDQQAERLLSFVVTELGARVVEWIDPVETFSHESSLDEEYLLTEATEFLAELASCYNEPFSFYSRDLRGDLLTAEEEISLGRQMEEGATAALRALARWPAGLAALFVAADQVACGDADPESFTTGPEPSSDGEAKSPEGPIEEEGADEVELDGDAAAFVAAVAEVRAAGADVPLVVDALRRACLSRVFLSMLAERASGDPEGADFAEALQCQAAARERMIVSNLRLALSIARNYLWSGLPSDDLIQEANIGLMKAVERYDWRKGFRFSTYATWWIRQQVTRSISNTARTVRVPVHVLEATRKILQEREGIEARLGRPETVAETAHRTGMALNKLEFLLSTKEDIVSLDDMGHEAWPSVPELFLAAPDSADPAKAADKKELRETLLAVLEDLDDRHRGVIVMRFGLGGQEEMTLEEVGSRFSVTRERIRQIESKVLKWLSHDSRKAILGPFMGEGQDHLPVQSQAHGADPLKVRSSRSRRLATGGSARSSEGLGGCLRK
ncbi:sigma-70 family RNA polymerase sigma factor [Ectothiorhodospira mobilis]|uniref:sigma-70 family RNA polymerase sigma factor n=1 Tax=Ectothiorhodospira mobilis TaxID=195064 RepID=UPI001EE97AA4|nr:sigma-70 family RNA polymerase sigma factor [Ectothiorhodospira mobilis]MCG5536689.1 sigma-70 family RNA polymerase sigma factor [Ectothiorhodospira mobilis]